MDYYPIIRGFHSRLPLALRVHLNNSSANEVDGSVSFNGLASGGVVGAGRGFVGVEAVYCPTAVSITNHGQAANHSLQSGFPHRS